MRYYCQFSTRKERELNFSSLEKTGKRKKQYKFYGPKGGKGAGRVQKGAVGQSMIGKGNSVKSLSLSLSPSLFSAKQTSLQTPMVVEFLLKVTPRHPLYYRLGYYSILASQRGVRLHYVTKHPLRQNQEGGRVRVCVGYVLGEDSVLKGPNQCIKSIKIVLPTVWYHMVESHSVQCKWVYENEAKGKDSNLAKGGRGPVCSAVKGSGGRWNGRGEEEEEMEEESSSIPMQK